MYINGTNLSMRYYFNAIINTIFYTYGYGFLSTMKHYHDVRQFLCFV